jgi:hypothetical protein
VLTTASLAVASCLLGAERGTVDLAAFYTFFRVAMGVFSSFWSPIETVAGETQMEAAMRLTLMRVQRNTARGGGR